VIVLVYFSLNIFSCYVTEVTDVETMEKVLGGYDAILVGYFTSDSDLKTEFLRSADSLREKYRFAHTTSEAVMDAQGHKE
jgi:protein disulfide isomerase family A protein 3